MVVHACADARSSLIEVRWGPSQTQLIVLAPCPQLTSSVPNRLWVSGPGKMPRSCVAICAMNPHIPQRTRRAVAATPLRPFHSAYASLDDLTRAIPKQGGEDKTGGKLRFTAANGTSELLDDDLTQMILFM